MGEFTLKMLVTAAVTVIAWGLGQAFDWEWMHWWVAGLIGVVVAFGGWFILVDGDL